MDRHYIEFWSIQGVFKIELFKDLNTKSNAYLSFDVILSPCRTNNEAKNRVLQTPRRINAGSDN